MKRQYHHGNLREALVAAARDHLRQNGDRELSLRELARKLGVSPNAPYRHFPTKELLTAALVSAGYRELTQVAEEALAADRPIVALAEGYQRFATREPALLQLLNAESFRGRDPESEAVLARDEWFAVLVAIVEREAGTLMADEAYRRAAGVWAVLQGCHHLKNYGGRGLLPPELHPNAVELARRIALGR